jgi:peptidoglycan hydrolase-like protein with peptidoglycan-binding domain
MALTTAVNSIPFTPTPPSTDDLGGPLPVPPASAPAPAPQTPAAPDDAYLGKVEKSPEFNKLDKPTQAAADAAMRAATTPEARRNIADLVTSPGFGKLSSTSQSSALTALTKDPANSDYASSVRTLVNNGGPYANLGVNSGGPAVKDMQKKLTAAGYDPGTADGQFGPQTLAAVQQFQKDKGLKVDGIAGPETLGELNQSRFSGLSQTAQVQTLNKVAAQSSDPQAVETVSKMATSPGFRQLAPADQTKLLNEVGGTNYEVSRGDRNAMNALLQTPGFEKASAADQTTQLKKFITNEPGAQSVLEPDAGAFDAKRAKYTVTGPVDAKNHAFASGVADAQQYQVEINGKKVPVFMPKTPTDGLQNHSIDQVAKGLAALPQSSLGVLKSVNVEPKTNPDDAYWSKQYKTPNFHSYMTAGADGVVQIYPNTGAPPSQDTLDGDLVHETGHTLSQQKWGSDDSDPRWQPWKDAAKSDGVHASTYAKNAPGEDFAETLKLYQLVKGTPQEAEMRQLMPARFKIIDGMVAGQ